MKPVTPLLALVLTAGCAGLTGPPPSPPLAVPAVGAPREFRWSPFQWKAGVVLTYQVHSFAEMVPGGREQSRYVIQLKGEDKTAKGLMRVRLLVDDLELGSMLIDEFGSFQDAIASKPEFAQVITGFAEWMQNLQWTQSQELKQVLSKPFAVGESITTEYPTSNLRRLMPRDWGQYLVSNITVKWQFTGYARLDGDLAAAFRYEMPNMLSSPILARDRDNREVRIDAFVGESVEYFDAVGGYSLANYEVLTGSGEIGGKQFSFRAVTLTTLDRKRSSGLQRPGASLGH